MGKETNHSEISEMRLSERERRRLAEASRKSVKAFNSELRRIRKNRSFINSVKVTLKARNNAKEKPPVTWAMDHRGMGGD